MQCECKKQHHHMEESHKQRNKQVKKRLNCVFACDHQFFAVFTKGKKVIFVEISKERFKKLVGRGVKSCTVRQKRQHCKCSCSCAN